MLIGRFELQYVYLEEATGVVCRFFLAFDAFKKTNLVCTCQAADTSDNGSIDTVSLSPVPPHMFSGVDMWTLWVQTSRTAHRISVKEYNTNI